MAKLTPQDFNAAYETFCTNAGLKDNFINSYRFGSFIGCGPRFTLKVFLATDDNEVSEELIPNLNEQAQWRIKALTGPNKETLFKAIKAKQWGWLETTKTYLTVSLLTLVLVCLAVPALVIAIYQDIRKK